MGLSFKGNSVRTMFFYMFFFLLLTTGSAFSSVIMPFSLHKDFVQNRAAEMEIHLIDNEARPMENALIQIGDAPGVPFADNQMITNASGIATVSIPEIAFDQELSVTISAHGFAHVTFSGKIDSTHVGQHKFSLQIHRHRDFSDIRTVTGKFSGWPQGVSKSRVEIGLFLPSFNVETLVGFDLGNLISPRMEEISVAGRTVQVPVNLVLPTQSKRYGIFPIRLSKPNFNIPLDAQMQNRFLGAAGSLPMRKLVNLAQKKDYLSIMNLVEFTRIGYTDMQFVEGNPNMPISLSTRLVQKKLENKVANFPSGLDLVAMSLFDPDTTLQTLLPVDIKAAKNPALTGHMQLAFPENARLESDAYVFNAAVEQRQLTQDLIEDLNFSAALTAVTWNGSKFEVTESEFLPLVHLGEADVNARVFPFAIAVAPTLGAVPTTRATPTQAEYFVFNLYSIAKNAGEKTQLRRVIWSAIVPSSAQEVRLPDLGRGGGISMPEMAHPQTFYWEVVAIRRNMSHNGGSGWDSTVSLRNLRQVSHARKKLTLP